MDLTRIIYLIPALLIGVIFHEVAHGYVAMLQGDPTAKLAGRLTLNPLSHLDPFGSILMPLLIYFGSGGRFMFGSAKPVPINPMYFRNGRRGLFWVGLAGPATNISIAVLAGLISRPVWGVLPAYLQVFVVYLVEINLILAIFNMIPVPPLDGSRLVEAFLPTQYLIRYRSIEQYGILIVFAFLIFFGGVFWGIVGPVMEFFFKLILPGAM